MTAASPASHAYSAASARRGAPVASTGHLPQDPGVDVDVLELGVGRGRLTGQEARAGGLDGGDQQLAVGAAVAAVPADGHAGGGVERDAVAGQGHLDEGLAARVGGEALEDAGDGGQRGLVAGDEQAVGLGRRDEVDAAVRAGRPRRWGRG